jgi:hypothetical protein
LEIKADDVSSGCGKAEEVGIWAVDGGLGGMFTTEIKLAKLIYAVGCGVRLLEMIKPHRATI